MVQWLLEAGANPNVDYQEGWTCLTYAIWYSHYEIVELLLKFGADVNQPSHMGTPLYLASFGSKSELWMQTSQPVELVRQLLLHGADPNNTIQKDIPFGFNLAKGIHHGLGKEVLFHYSPLQIALGSKEWDIAMLLINFGADTTYKNVLGETGLHLMMQPLSQTFFQKNKATCLDDEMLGILLRTKPTEILETLLLKLTPTRESCFLKNIFGQTPLHLAHLSQDKLLSLLKKRIIFFNGQEDNSQKMTTPMQQSDYEDMDTDIPQSDHDSYDEDMDTSNEDIDTSDPHIDYESLGVDFLGRNALGECIHPNPLGSYKLALLDQESLLTGIDLPEILNIVKRMDFWDAVESLQRTYPIWDTQAINHSILCNFMLNLLQKKFKTHRNHPIPWKGYIYMYKQLHLSLQPFIMSVIGCIENNSLPPQEFQNFKTALASTPLEKREQILLSCMKDGTLNTAFIAHCIIHNQLEILPILFVLSASSASLVLRQLYEAGAPLPLYHIIDKYQRLCYFALFQKIGLHWSQEQTPLFQKWLEDIKKEDHALSKSSPTVTSFEDIFQDHRPIKTQGRCLFVEYQGRQMIMKIRYKHESQHRFMGSAVLSEGKQHDNTGLFQRCDRIQKVTLSEDLRAQCERMIQENSEGMEEVELSTDASLFESENYFSYINDINDEQLFWNAVKNNMAEYSESLFKGRLFHRFLGLNHDLNRPINFAIFIIFISYYTHNLGSYQKTSEGVKWPNFGLNGGRDPDNIYDADDFAPSLSSFYTKCLQHIGIDTQTLFKEVGSLSCLMELTGSIEITLLDWYRQRPHLLSALKPDEFTDKMITHVYQVILEKLWNRPLLAEEIETIKNSISPLMDTDLKIFKNNPDIIDTSVMPFRCRDFPLQNLVMARVTLIHLALACPDKTLPHFPASPPRSQNPQQPSPPHERCYRYRQLIEKTITSPLVHNVEHCLHILKQEDDAEIRFALEEILLDRLSSLKNDEAFICASFQLMNEHAESIYHRALFCGSLDVLRYLDKHYQPRYPYPKGISNTTDALFRYRNPVSLKYWLKKHPSFMSDPERRHFVLKEVIKTNNINIWQEYTSYCHRHHISPIAFAFDIPDSDDSIFLLMESGLSLPLIESILECFQKEIHFKTHLSLHDLAQRFYLRIIKPGDMQSSTYNLSPPPFYKFFHPKVARRRALTLLQQTPTPSLPNGGLDFKELFLTAFNSQDKDLMDDLIHFATKIYPSDSIPQLWQRILSLVPPIRILDQTSAYNFLWFHEIYPHHARHLHFQIMLISERSLFFKLKEHTSRKTLLKELSNMIVAHQYSHFDDILSYKEPLDIGDKEWEDFLNDIIQQDPLSPAALCILKHKRTSLLPHEIPKIDLHVSLVLFSQPPILSQIKPYATSQSKLYIEMAIAVMIGDIYSVKNILNRYTLPYTFVHRCLLLALTSDRRKLSRVLKRYIQTFPTPVPPPKDFDYITLKEQCPIEEPPTLSQKSLLEHLYRVKHFSAKFDGLEKLLIRLLESGWFSPDTNSQVLLALYELFFQPRLLPSDFFQHTSYFLYNDIEQFLISLLSNKPPSSQVFPSHFFRPISSHAPLYLNDNALSTRTRLLLQKSQSHFKMPCVSHIYA